MLKNCIVVGLVLVVLVGLTLAEPRRKAGRRGTIRKRFLDLRDLDTIRARRRTYGKSARRHFNELNSRGLRRDDDQDFERKKKKQPLLPSDFSPPPRRPNIILMMTDDQDVELGSLQFMPKLNRYLRDEGVHFENGFVTTPMCCPSRSSMLTGLYAHNHNVLTNNDNCSSTDWVHNHEPRTFAAYLNQAGYKTGYFGKYLNKYGGNHIPEGWDHWEGLVKNSRFYNYTVNVNGKKVRHGFDYHKDYFPDLITNNSLSFFRQSKQSSPDEPVMMVMSYPGPHGPEDSAPQYNKLFFNVTTHHTPAYDYAPNPDKQWILQVTDRMEPIQKQFTDILMTKRLQTLQSIDDGIEQLYNTLSSLNELDNTYIFYTSDHGYHLGQFGLVKGKGFPFDVDIKVPFFVRGPKGMAGVKDFPRGTSRSEPVINIDLAPTFLDIAGVKKPAHMDGKSVLDIVNNIGPKRDSILVERGKMTRVRFDKISNVNTTPAFELDNETNAIGRKVFERLNLTKQERLAVECLRPKYQAPCSPFQKLKCVRQRNGAWKLRRCQQHHHLVRPKVPQCNCKPGDKFGWRRQIGRAESDVEITFRSERRLQSQFIGKHTGVKSFRKQHKFLKSLSSHHGVRKRNRRRNKRDEEESLEDEEEDSLEEDEDYNVFPRLDEMNVSEPDFDDRVTSVNPTLLDDNIGEIEASPEDDLEVIAKDGIGGVDTIMEGISDEILDLQQSINGSYPSSFHPSDLKCHLTPSDEVNCSSEIYNSRSDWRNSRTVINEQIRRLRAQLFELKEIRKHLRTKRPFQTEENEGRDEEDSFNTEESNWKKAEKNGRQIPNNAVECRCNEPSELRRASRRERVKLQRLRRRLRRKARRQQQRKKLRKRKMKVSCSVGAIESSNTTFTGENSNLNCFSHDNSHWRTQPFWNLGAFCACTNSNTNTYWCVRTVNITHNYLYCEFVSGIITYYDLNVDPYQLRNIYHTLDQEELNYMHSQLLELKDQKGEEKDEEPEVRVAGLTSHRMSRKERRKKNQERIRRNKSFIKSGNLPPFEAFHHRRRNKKGRRYYY